MVVMFGVAGSQHGRLLELRSEYELDAVVYLENAPPVVAFTTTVLGGFRGIIADVLWLRISHLQEKGDYFELVQLADWVAKLEPRNTEIWAFHAWNMAYNVSVMMSEPRDRWRWVHNGIKLLRDEGLVCNPGDAELYRELGWLFQHKIGRDMDVAHQYYKDRWAGEMKGLLGGPHPDLVNLDDQTRQRMIEEYKLVPEIMAEIEDKYGRLDWLRPETHAIYWAYRGLKFATDKNNSRFRCNAMIRQGLDYLKRN